MTLPYYLLLIIYGISLLVCAFFFFINVYHLHRFGFFDFSAKLHICMVGGVCVIAFIFSVIFLRQVQWFDGIDLVSDFSVNLGNYE